MYSCGASKKRRMTAGIIGSVMLVLVFFSAFYIAVEISHDCSGEDCPVCACMELCKNNLSRIGSGQLIRFLLSFKAILILFTVLNFLYIFSETSLVSFRIRLDD